MKKGLRFFASVFVLIALLASAAAAAARGLCDYDTEILAHLDGGDLRITVGRDGKVRMEGPCEFVYEGDTEIC